MKKWEGFMYELNTRPEGLVFGWILAVLAGVSILFGLWMLISYLGG